MIACTSSWLLLRGLVRGGGWHGQGSAGGAQSGVLTALLQCMFQKTATMNVTKDIFCKTKASKQSVADLLSLGRFQSGKRFCFSG